MIDALVADSELGWAWKVRSAIDGGFEEWEALAWRSAELSANSMISVCLLLPAGPGGIDG